MIMAGGNPCKIAARIIFLFEAPSTIPAPIITAEEAAIIPTPKICPSSLINKPAKSIRAKKRL